jgi:hypothetical protein
LDRGAGSIVEEVTDPLAAKGIENDDEHDFGDQDP